VLMPLACGSVSLVRRPCTFATDRIQANDFMEQEIRTFRLRDGALAPEWLSEFEALARPSFIDASELVAEEVRRCNVAYLLIDDTGELGAFFLVGWREGDLPAPGVHDVYLGLSAARQGAKGRGLAGSLYRAFQRDAAAWEAAHGQRLLVWFTTASPVVVAAGWHLFADPEPRPDGSFSATRAQMLSAIMETEGLTARACSLHPFVLRGVARARYSIEETERLSALGATAASDMLAQLRINEKAGDRLVCTACIPL
jgi:hypothetical protein